jgi:hypothetical protein
VAIINAGVSLLNCRDSIVKGDIKAVVPSTNPTLVILLPIILARAKSPDPLRDAIIDTANSGAEVPKPIITAPIKNGLTLNLLDKFMLPVTRKSPP